MFNFFKNYYGSVLPIFPCSLLKLEIKLNTSLAAKGALAHRLQRHTPYMRKGEGKREKRLMIKVATTSLPAVDRPNADRWNAARSCQ